MSEPMKRPLGVSILAYLNLLVIAWDLWICLLLFLKVVSGGARMGPLALVYGAYVVFTPLLWLPLPIVMAVGLLRLKNWARIMCIICSVLGFFVCMKALGISLLSAKSMVPVYLILMTLQVVVVFYLATPSVRLAFAASDEEK